jgi:hypothetical protein
MCAKTGTMILVMEVALQVNFAQKCELKQPNLWLNIPLRLCSAVAILIWCINVLGIFFEFKYF